MNDDEWTAAGDVGPAVRRTVPTTGGADELLADPPMGAPPGGLDGYRAGRPLRIGIVVLLACAIGGTAWLVERWRTEAAAAAAAPKLPSYTLAEDVDDGDRPQQLIWSEGVARLGLARAQPGVQEIVLPDRRIRLAPGSDIAQIKVEVRAGKTVSMTTLVGHVIELPPEDPGSPPARSATAP